MKKLLKHRKALSPVVAAIILIAVTVAVSIAVAAWMGALTFTFMATEELKILSVSFGESGISGMAIDVQNTGTTILNIVEVKAGGQTYGDGETTIVQLSAGSKDTITWNGFTWNAGTTYDIELLTAKGNRFITRATAPQT